MSMRMRPGWVLVVALALGLSACGSDASPTSTTSATAATSTTSSTESTTPESTVAPESTEPIEQASAFPIGTFARIGEDPVSEDLAAEFQDLLNDMAADGGMSATVMTPEGTWSGTAGKADGVRDVVVDDQFAIGSVTKSVVAAQIMQLVEAGDLSLDDLADEHLPADLDFDTNQATIRDLLSHRSGLRNTFFDFIWDTLATDRQHVWTLSEVLELTGDPVRPAGLGFE
jgi:CubicO group peptidase (beta-lactamase class C family)